MNRKEKTMNYVKSEKYNTPDLMAKIMGPNPIKLEEELLLDHRIPEGSGELRDWTPSRASATC